MSNPRLFPRARAALALVPLATVLACASGARQEPRPLARPPVSDTASVAIGDGKSIEHMLAGRVSGVNVTQSANGGIVVRIRGGSNTFYGSNEPLFVVDDVALPHGTGGVISVNPYDIEKIEVLNNPADTGIYGLRGANGVVKITTKSAAARKP